MQFSESWLRTFCNPALSSAQLADVLTAAGLEVEEMHAAATPFSGVVVGEVVACEQHPDADRLRVCKVDVGKAQLLQIVCGAPNARVGIKVPCAKVGALLPPVASGTGMDSDKPFQIKLGKLRGVESHGMLCSAKELHISAEGAGLLELAADATVGQSIREHLNLDDVHFTLKLTPNLAHCNSVLGIAREVSALTGAPLVMPNISPVLATLVAQGDTLQVNVAAPDLCGRFAGRVVRGIDQAAPTPAWMVQRLASCGQRSVNALVDISNYVMFELGQPSHMFDLAKIRGGLTVRWAREGETLKLLNGNTVTLDPSVGVIADEAQVESLAGIMGGDATAIGEGTQDIYIEAAFWHPKAVVGRSRRYNFATDAGYRFERGVDPQLPVQALERLTALVLEICGGQAAAIDDQNLSVPQQPPVQLRLARAQKVIGLDVSLAQCVDALTRLGLAPQVLAGDLLQVQPPSYRFDLSLEEDLIEEVARVVGFNALPNTPPVAPAVARARSERSVSGHQLRHRLAHLGYQETINFSFVPDAWERDLAGNAAPIALQNPIARQMNVMRSSLMGSLLQVLKYNVDRKAADVRVFELGRVFLRNPNAVHSAHGVQGVDQPMRVAGLIYGSRAPLGWTGDAAAANLDFFDIKADVETLLQSRGAVSFVPSSHPALHPGRSADVYLNGVCVGSLGELHPKHRQAWELPKAPLLFELHAEALQQTALPKFSGIPKQLPVVRDLAVVVDEGVTYDALQASINKIKTAAGTHTETAAALHNAVVFDIYRATDEASSAKSGLLLTQKSLAVRLSFADDSRTLTDAEVDAQVQAVVAQLALDFNAKLRA